MELRLSSPGAVVFGPFNIFGLDGSAWVLTLFFTLPKFKIAPEKLMVGIGRKMIPFLLGLYIFRGCVKLPGSNVSIIYHYLILPDDPTDFPKTTGYDFKSFFACLANFSSSLIKGIPFFPYPML